MFLLLCKASQQPNSKWNTASCSHKLNALFISHYLHTRRQSKSRCILMRQKLQKLTRSLTEEKLAETEVFKKAKIKTKSPPLLNTFGPKDQSKHSARNCCCCLKQGDTAIPDWLRWDDITSKLGHVLLLPCYQRETEEEWSERLDWTCHHTSHVTLHHHILNLNPDRAVHQNIVIEHSQQPELQHPSPCPVSIRDL